MVPSRVMAALGSMLVACANPQYGAAHGEREDADASAVGGAGLDAAISAVRAEAGLDARSAVEPGLTAGPDASSQAPVGPLTTDRLPDWALPLLGSYATQAFSFSKDKLGTVSMAEELSLVQIVRVGEGAELRTRLCSMVASSTVDVLRIVNPSGLAEVTRKLEFDDAGHWASAGVPFGYGYEREVPAACIGREDQFIARRDHQVWLTDGTCRCPTSADAAPRIDDCRVLDPDHDTKPGITYLDKGQPGALLGSFIDSSVYAVYVSRSHAVGGRVDPAGAHYADLMMDEVAYQLSCEPSGCPQIGDVGRPCTSTYNSLHFARLSPGSPSTSCEQVLMSRTALFPNKAPATPSTCTQQVLTDDPTRM